MPHPQRYQVADSPRQVSIMSSRQRGGVAGVLLITPFPVMRMRVDKCTITTAVPTTKVGVPLQVPGKPPPARQEGRWKRWSLGQGLSVVHTNKNLTEKAIRFVFQLVFDHSIKGSLSCWFYGYMYHGHLGYMHV